MCRRRHSDSRQFHELRPPAATVAPKNNIPRKKTFAKERDISLRGAIIEADWPTERPDTTLPFIYTITLLYGDIVKHILWRQHLPISQ